MIPIWGECHKLTRALTERTLQPGTAMSFHAKRNLRATTLLAGERRASMSDFRGKVFSGRLVELGVRFDPDASQREPGRIANCLSRL